MACDRQIWTNDIQQFPALVAKTLFGAQHPPIASSAMLSKLMPYYRRNLSALQKQFDESMEREKTALTSGSLRKIIGMSSDFPYVGNDDYLECTRKRLHRQPKTFPYRLFSITYPCTFFGLQQCMEIDSLRYAVDEASEFGLLDVEQRNWAIIAIGQAASKANNSTGQFAEYIKPRSTSLQRYIGKRRRSILEEFCAALDCIKPIGSSKWRASNKFYRGETLDLLLKLRKKKLKPRIVYADPPYSVAQYSRYYHVLDVLVDYNYPFVSGTGRYPTGRFQTPFSIATQVESALTKLIQRVAELDAVLLLSYPENGLYCSRGRDILQLLASEFRRTRVAHCESQNHSTFGGRAVASKVRVSEKLFVAYN